MKQTRSLASDTKRKRRILLGTLVPLTVIGVALGTALPLTLCSSNNNEQPLPTSSLTIDSSNFSTYLTGTYPNVTGTTTDFIDYLINNPVDKIIFKIDGLNTAVGAFAMCSGLMDPSKHIPIEFNSSAPITFAAASFAGCASISQIIISGANSTISSVGQEAFKNCNNLTGFSRGSGSGLIILSAISSGSFDNASFSVNQINDTVISITGCTYTAGNDINSGYWLKTGQSNFAGGLSNFAIGDIKCPPTWTSLSCTAFSNCYMLTKITNLPGGKMGNPGDNGGTFNSCKNLLSVEFVAPITDIHTSAFGYCKKLNSIKLNGYTNGSTIDSAAFNECGKDGGTIIGTGAATMLTAIRTVDGSWLPGWTATT